MRDHDGQQLAYVYFEDEPGRRSAAKLLTKDEARRIAVNIAKLPDWCEIRAVRELGLSAECRTGPVVQAVSATSCFIKNYVIEFSRY